MSPKVDANLPSPAQLDGELAALSVSVEAADGGGPLDRAYASLDRVEDYLTTALDGVQGTERELLVRRVEWYVGATLIQEAHGAWAIHEDVGGSSRPHVVKLPELGKSLGRSLNEFKRASQDLQNTLEQEIELEEQKEQQVKTRAADTGTTTDGETGTVPRST